MVDPTPVLFYQISATDTRVLVDVPSERYAGAGGVREYFVNHVAPQLPAGVLRDAFLAAATSQEAKCMPCMALSGGAPARSGCVALGDTLNMRHPLTGGGMTVALKDVELLADCLCRDAAGAALPASGWAAGDSPSAAQVAAEAAAAAAAERLQALCPESAAAATEAKAGAEAGAGAEAAARSDAAAVAEALDAAPARWREATVSLSEPPALAAAVRAFYARRSRHAATINILANALYRVFSRPAADADGRRARLRAACIEYLSMGGAFAAGPVGLLSGLTPASWVLVTHFFFVALFAIGRAVLPLPTPTRLRQGYDLMHVACTIIMPLLAAEKATFLSWGAVGAAVNVLFPWKGVSAE